VSTEQSVSGKASSQQSDSAYVSKEQSGSKEIKIFDACSAEEAIECIRRQIKELKRRGDNLESVKTRFRRYK
jgi:fatty acid-binding protein DegV